MCDFISLVDPEVDLKSQMVSVKVCSPTSDTEMPAAEANVRIHVTACGSGGGGISKADRSGKDLCSFFPQLDFS